jgi:hypothetical protein
MKIELDMNDILGDDYGVETLQDSIRRQVIDCMTASVRKGVETEIKTAVAQTITTEIQAFIKAEMPTLMADLLVTEYTPVGRYGEKSHPTTFRAELVKSITENMVYKRATYDNDKNVFTKAVDEVIASHVREFKTAFVKQVDADFTAQVMSEAQAALKKKLGLA